jgi:outer membrane protein
MKIFATILLMTFATGIFAQTKEDTLSLTLDEAISIALQKNTDLIKSTNNLLSKKASVKNAYGDFLPNLNASASWHWNKIKDEGGEQLDYLGNIVVTPPSEEDSRNYSLGVSGSWTLFNGLSNYSNLQKTKKELKAAKLSLEKLKQDIVLQTRTLFYSVIKNRYIMKVREENVRYNKKFLETIEEKHKLGSVPIADVYSQQVQLGNAELAFIQAQNDYENAKAKLLDFLSLDVTANYKFESELGKTKIPTDIDEFMQPIDEMVETALANRPDFLGQKLAVEAAEENLTMARSGYFPRLTGNYGLSTSAAGVNKLFNRKTFSAGLNLSFPIFSNFNTSAQVQYAKVGELNAREDLRAYERKIKMEIKQAYENLLAAKKGLEVSRKTVLAAKQTRETVTEKYNMGAATIVEVLKADKDYQDALRNQIEAANIFLVQKETLLNALGKLDYKKFQAKN